MCPRDLQSLHSGVTEGPEQLSRQDQEGWRRYGISPINERQSPLIAVIVPRWDEGSRTSMKRVKVD